MMQSWVLIQLGDQDGIASEDGLYLLGSGITATQPHHLGRTTVEPTALRKVAVLSHDAKLMRLGVLPNFVVGSLPKTKRADMCGLREEICKAGG